MWSEQEYETMFREELSKSDLYLPSHDVLAHISDPNLPRVSFSFLVPPPEDGKSHYLRQGTFLDLEQIGDVLYGLSARVIPELRGAGYGWSLYEAWERLARRLGCRQIRGTPSGKTPWGETRAEWMCRRGFRLEAANGYGGVEAVKDL